MPGCSFMEIKEASDLVIDKVESWTNELIAMLPNLALAVVIVVIAWFAARLGRKGVEGLMHKVTHKKTLIDLISNIAYVIIILVGLFIALGVLELDKTVTSLLAGAGIIGLALGFAFQDIASNFMSGIIMAIRSPFAEGDIIESQDKTGVVQRLSLRSTVLRSFQGQDIIIPNKDIFQNAITNYSRLGKRRVDLEVGVSYGDDLEKVKRISLEAVSSVESVLKNDDLSLYYTGFGDSSINFVVRFWIKFNRQAEFLSARSEAIMAIKKAYDQNDITIPFPIRTLDFGIKGGEKLNEAWPK